MLASRETSLPISFSANQRCVVFCEAASSHPSSVRTAMLVFTRAVWRFRRRAPLVTAAFAWISATSGVRNRSWVISVSAPRLCLFVVAKRGDAYL